MKLKKQQKKKKKKKKKQVVSHTNRDAWQLGIVDRINLILPSTVFSHSPV